MAKPARKVAVSIPAALYQAVERVRKASGRRRSSGMQDALRHRLASPAPNPLGAGEGEGVPAAHGGGREPVRGRDQRLEEPDERPDLARLAPRVRPRRAS